MPISLPSAQQCPRHRQLHRGSVRPLHGCRHLSPRHQALVTLTQPPSARLQATAKTLFIACRLLLTQSCAPRSQTAARLACREVRIYTVSARIGRAIRPWNAMNPSSLKGNDAAIAFIFLVIYVGYLMSNANAKLYTQYQQQRLHRQTVLLSLRALHRPPRSPHPTQRSTPRPPSLPQLSPEVQCSPEAMRIRTWGFSLHFCSPLR